jgi:hypothetical protein
MRDTRGNLEGAPLTFARLLAIQLRFAICPQPFPAASRAASLHLWISSDSVRLGEINRGHLFKKRSIYGEFGKGLSFPEDHRVSMPSNGEPSRSGYARNSRVFRGTRSRGRPSEFSVGVGNLAIVDAGLSNSRDSLL